jgi:hypothetical protein
MELVLKNINPKDYSLISHLAKRLGIQVEEKLDQPDHATAIEDLRDAMTEIKMAEARKLKLQNARDLINAL